MSIQIFVDSGADLDAADYQELGISLIPLSLTIDQRTFAATEKFNKVDFFRMLEMSDIFPKTSQPAPSEFETIFESARQAGDDLIFISIAASLSGTNQSGNVVKGLGEYDNVYVVDSASATLGIKLLAVEAVRQRREGKSAPEIVAALERLKGRIRLYAALDTLEYLRRGGRLSGAAASIGSLARIKPVVTLTSDGSVGIVAKCMGKSRAMKEIADLAARVQPDPDYPIYGVYAGSSENLQAFLPRLRALGIEIPERDQICIGPVIGAHIGPGAFGVVYIEKE